jgi:deoxyribodipyrimidine photo-lyase
LVKNLNIDWRQGMDWFWDCLADADLANNSVNWQWVAGSGVDAVPYFRIFNPITQGEKFDNNGDYTKKFVPELKNMPNKYLFKPWTAPANVLKAAKVILGVTYPMPIIDFPASRKNALERYRKVIINRGIIM